jgi:hypothetical protein
MIHTSHGSRAAAPLERHASEAIGARPIFITWAIAATVVSAVTIALPALARSGSGAAGSVGASGSAGSGAPSHTAARGPTASSSPGHRFSGTGSPPASSSPVRKEEWHHASTPPGWTGHGEKRGWDGGRMSPGLSRRDHDLRSHHHWDDERGDHERAQFHTGQPERRWVGDWGYDRKSQ